MLGVLQHIDETVCNSEMSVLGLVSLGPQDAVTVFRRQNMCVICRASLAVGLMSYEELEIRTNEYERKFWHRPPVPVTKNCWLKAV
jgi:hypothetical protein